MRRGVTRQPLDSIQCREEKRPVSVGANENTCIVDLEGVLAAWNTVATTLRAVGHSRDAELIERVCAEVTVAAEDYLRWLSEPEATLRSGRSPKWLRSQFSHWEREGNARREQSARLYRMLVVPTHSATTSSLEAERQAGKVRKVRAA